MSKTEHAEIMGAIASVWQDMGGRGTKGGVVAHLGVVLPPHLRRYLTDQGLSTKVGQFFRSLNDDGLPTAPEIDAHGTHAQLELLDVDEFRYAVARQMSNSAAARRRAKRYADLCWARHNVRIDIDNPFEEAV